MFGWKSNQRREFERRLEHLEARTNAVSATAEIEGHLARTLRRLGEIERLPYVEAKDVVSSVRSMQNSINGLTAQIATFQRMLDRHNAKVDAEIAGIPEMTNAKPLESS